MKKVIVTGAGGQLGKTIEELSPQFRGFVFVFKNSEELDITNFDSLQQELRTGEYDFCINCAAYTNVEQAEKSPKLAFSVNSDAVKHIAQACSQNGIALVHISTDYVFDGEKVGAYTAEDPTNPINEYGKSKLKGEQYIQNILEQYYIVRTSWLYSKKYGHNFYRTILNKAKSGEDLFITDAQIGCPTNTVSLAKFILNDILANSKPYGLYHFTDGKPMTWFDFAQQILEENGYTDKVHLVLDRNYRTFAKRPKNSVLMNN